MHAEISHTHLTNLKDRLQLSKNSHFLILADVRTVRMFCNADVFPQKLHRALSGIFLTIFLSTCTLVTREYYIIFHSAEHSGEGKD